MELFLAFLVKLLVIFVGSGFISLIAYWIGNEVSLIPIQFFKYKSKKEINVVQQTQISSRAGLYEILTETNFRNLSGRPIRVFSSHKGMRLI